MRRENGVDQGGFSQSGLSLDKSALVHVHVSFSKLTNANDIELETSLQQLLLDLGGDGVETNMAPWEHSVPLRHGCGHDCDGRGSLNCV